MNQYNNIKNIPILIIDDECDHSLNGKDYLNAVERLTDRQREGTMKLQINLGDTWEKLGDEFGIGIDKLKQISNFTGNNEPKQEVGY